MPISISGSVGGSGGQNRPEDVRTVYDLFNKTISVPLAVSDQVSEELIAAIRDFQSSFMSRPDGRIDVGGRTWRELIAVIDDSGTEITGSVGQGGQNRPSDVRIVYALFNNILANPLTVNDQVSAELIQAIKDFQKPFFSRPDGRIDVGGRTWGKLITATEMPDTENPGGGGEPVDPPIEPGGEINVGGANAAWTARYQWNDSYEAEFARWVEELFADKKGSLAACLRNPDGNSLYSDEDRNNSIFSDCADLPYLLRAYFSYKKKLPFSFNSSISGSRYSNNNKPGSRRSFLSYSSFSRMARTISNSVHSGFFRFFWTTEKIDTFLCQVNRESIVPGTVYYDANGHVLVVSRVDDDGTVWFVDAHPDNSLTEKRFGSYLSRGSCKQGGGFRRWRHQEVSSSGSFTLTNNSNSPFFDEEQSQCQDSYLVDGLALDYHQWVKRMLATGSGKVDPIKEIQQQLTALDQALQDRAISIDAAISFGIHKKSHPSSLPYNIYGTEGDWEAYSTPGRDARLRAQVREIYNLIKDSVSAVAQGDHPYAFEGTAVDLLRQFDSIWQESTDSIRIGYGDSSGKTITLTLGDIMERLFLLSFDPYHCPELRWGDVDTASCPNGSSKRWWYEQEQRLRNVIDTDHRVNTTLDWGPVNTPDIDVGNLLERLQQEYS
ncbi:Peptidoglycan binding domain-containing protein [Candidatus Electrothrix laxa]